MNLWKKTITTGRSIPRHRFYEHVSKDGILNHTAKALHIYIYICCFDQIGHHLVFETKDGKARQGCRTRGRRRIRSRYGRTGPARSLDGVDRRDARGRGGGVEQRRRACLSAARAGQAGAGAEVGLPESDGTRAAALRLPAGERAAQGAATSLREQEEGRRRVARKEAVCVSVRVRVRVRVSSWGK